MRSTSPRSAASTQRQSLSRASGAHPSWTVVEDFDGDTYRAFYTVRFAEVVYVLHAFQKKSKTGAATPAKEIEKVKSRLKRAAEEYKAWRSAKG